MRSQRVSQKEFQFYFPEMDNALLVECAEDGSVVIRATRDNVSARRKAFFIRQLATEGFIPDQYQWWGGDSMDGSRGVSWVVDYSWLRIPAKVKRRTNRFMRGLLVTVSLLWFVLVGGLVLWNGQPAREHSRVPAAPAPVFQRDNR